MRSSLHRGSLLAAALILLSACSSSGSTGGDGKGSGSASPSGAAAKGSASGSAAEPDASPLAIAITSKTSVVLSKVEGGVWIADQLGKHTATAKDDGDLEDKPAPTGLPDDILRVQYAGGRLPTALWLSVSTPPTEGKKAETNPFYMLDAKKGAWKSVTEDWQPLIVPWSKKRVLAMSTSSGKLKIKTLSPYTKTPLPDQPSMKVPDPECAKSLKLADAATITPDLVIGVGRCKLGASKQPTYVLLRWKTPEKSAEPAVVEPSPAPESSATPDAPPSPDADSDVGVPMTITALTTDRSQHRAIAFAAGSAFVASGTEAGEARVFDVSSDGDGVAVELPKLEGPLLDLTLTTGGDLVLVTKTAVWRRTKSVWTSIAPPRGVDLEHAKAAGDVVWLTGTRGTEGLVMRLGAGSASLTW